MKHIKQLLIAFIAICTICTSTYAKARYRGENSQTEAVGIIMGTYMITASTLEKCQTYPRLKTSATKALQEYLTRNQQTYMDVMRKLPQLANENGGSMEVERLKKEIEECADYIIEQIPKVLKNRVVSETEAIKYIDEINTGMWDLLINNNNEVTRILKP